MSGLSLPLSSPSDGLAILAEAMIRSPSLERQTLQDALDSADADTFSPEEWLIPGPELAAEIVSALGGWPPSPPGTVEEFVCHAVALQRLDRWHRPLLPSEIDMPRLAEHELLLDLMALEDRYNSNPEHGTVIARQSFGSPFLRIENAEFYPEDTSNPYAVLCSLLDICVFFPPSVAAGDPDAESSEDGNRLIALRFRRFPPEELGLPWPPDILRLAVAPIFESGHDASLWVEEDRYSITPNVPFSRFEAVIRDALSRRAHILLLPEMTVEAAFLVPLGAAMRNLRRQAYLANPDQTPSLRLAIIGVIEPPRSNGAPHRNFIVAMNADGQILFEQDKLSHWNLDDRTRARFGIEHPTLLRENTGVGNSILITEFDGLGRVLALICADMSHNLPGDWIADNIGLDFLYAPIMDGSTCWAQGCPPWIVTRAIRLCERSGVTAVVTNSMAMTFWNNQVIAQSLTDPDNKYVMYQESGIGFTVRKQGEVTVWQHCAVNLADVQSPVLRIIDWSQGWTDASVP